MVSPSWPTQVAIVVAVFGGGAVALLLSAVARRRRETPAARRFQWVLLGSAGWCFGYGLMLVSPTAGAALAFETLSSGFALASVFLWFVFVVDYTGNGDRLTPRTLALLWAVPTAYYLLFVTNPMHGWVRETSVVEVGSLRLVAVSETPLEVAGAVYSLLFVGAGLVLLTRFLVSTRNVYRKQTAAIILGTLSTAVGYVLYQVGAPLHPAFNPSALFFLAQAIFVGLALFRYDFLDVSPMATELYLEQMADPLLVVDREERLLDCNEAAREALSLDRADVETRVSDAVSALRGIADGDVPEHVTVPPAGTQPSDAPVPRDHGGVTYEPTTTPIEDQHGIERGWLVVLRDVSERVTRERQLERKNEQLDQFAGVVSHDLKNPLSIAKGYAETAYEREDVAYLPDSVAAMERMETLIDDLLTLAREGRAVDDPGPVDLRPAVEGAWRETPSDGARLENDATGAILADGGRFEVLLTNLFRNAVTHGSTDGSTDNSTDAPTADDGGGSDSGVAVRVGIDDGRLFVEDDGRGIPESERTEVFEMGYTDSEDGTGLGLAIVGLVAEAHGWDVDVGEGAEGGARFELSGLSWVGAAGQPEPSGGERVD